MIKKFSIKLFYLFMHFFTMLRANQHFNRELFENAYRIKLLELNNYKQRQFDAMSLIIYPTHSSSHEFTYDYVVDKLRSMRVDQHSYTFLNRINKIMAAIKDTESQLKYIYNYFLEPFIWHDKEHRLLRTFEPNLFTKMREHLIKINITYENAEVAANCKKSALDCKRGGTFEKEERCH
jgi:hypothetical protein